MINIKGCLSTILVVLLLAFVAFFVYREYQEEGLDFLEPLGITSEDLSDAFSKIEYNNENVISFLESVGLLDPADVYKEPINFKPSLNLENTHFPEEPRTVEDFRRMFLYMANENMLEIEIHYPDSYEENFVLSNEIQNNCSTAFDDIVVEYVDLYSGISKADYKMIGNSLSSSISIKLSSQYVSDEELVMQQEYFEESARTINNNLHAENILSFDMTDTEKAEAIFAYVTQNLSYDSNVNYESYTGYGATKNHYAVCQGYTALYNYLLKLNNIYCIGQSGYVIADNAPHIWTVALLDGTKSYSDVTFGDPTPDREGYTDYQYFDASKEFLSKTRVGVE